MTVEDLFISEAKLRDAAIVYSDDRTALNRKSLRDAALAYARIAETANASLSTLEVKP